MVDINLICMEFVNDMATSAASKKQMIHDLIDFGFICNCSLWIFDENDDYILIHEIDCRAKDKILELVNKE